ncbi:MAG: hypothetical protein WC958_02450 [Dehalococcoidales bacterium]
MFDKISSFFQTANETISTIRWLLGVLAVMGMIASVTGKWLEQLNAIQLWGLIIAIITLLLIVITFIIDWKIKKDIESIPDLIEKIDVITSNFVDDYSLNLSEEQWKNLFNDYQTILGIDFHSLSKAIEYNKDKKAIEKEFDTVNRAYMRKISINGINNKTEQALLDLGDMSSILDTYHAGLNELKSTHKYKHYEKRIKSLQRKASSAYISVQISNYFTISERYYYMLLSTKPLYENPILKEKLPARIYAKKSQLKPLVERQISILIAGVREAILKHKERNLRDNISEQSNGKGTVQNRAQRRANK